MSNGWVPFVSMIGVIVIAIFIAGFFGFDKRLSSWWVSWAHRLGKFTGPFSFLVSAVIMLCYAIVLVAGMAWTERLGHSLWALFFMLPQTLMYAPFVLITIPSQTGYGAWRDDLKKAGASPKQQRQIAWWAGLPSLAVMAIAFGVWFSMLLP